MIQKNNTRLVLGFHLKSSLKMMQPHYIMDLTYQMHHLFHIWKGMIMCLFQQYLKQNHLTSSRYCHFIFHTLWGTLQTPYLWEEPMSFPQGNILQSILKRKMSFTCKIQRETPIKGLWYLLWEVGTIEKILDKVGKKCISDRKS